MQVELLGGAFFFCVALFVAIGRSSGLKGDVSGFVLLNAGFASNITWLLITAQLAIGSVAARRARIHAALPPPSSSAEQQSETRSSSLGESKQPPATRPQRAASDEHTLLHTASAVEVSLTDVSLGYQPDAPPVISRLSLHIQPGERVGIVGRTGSGKTTLLRALCGLISCREGEVRLSDTCHGLSRLTRLYTPYTPSDPTPPPMGPHALTPRPI